MSAGVPHRNASAYESAREKSGLAETWAEKTQKAQLEIANERFVERIKALCARTGWRVPTSAEISNQ